MLRFRKPPLSLVCFLAAVVGIGAAFGHLVNALGFAAFFFFVAGIDPKPAWSFWFGKPGSQYDGRGWKFNSRQRVGATSQKEIRSLPNIKD
jgi:hypothetical protein